jgi:hypothetical protein
MTDDDDTQVYRSELEAAVKAAIEAERERLLATDIHSCHANCERFACVQTRKAVEAERERIIEKNAPVIEQINAHMKEAVAAEREALIALLKGIDQTETESPDGWWETSTGADFGAGILAAIRAQVYRSELEAAVKAAVEAEQTAVLQTIEEFMGSEQERHPMFSDGYDYALSHIQQFIKGRQT